MKVGPISDGFIQPAVVSPIEAWERGKNKLRILLVIASPIDEPERLSPEREVQEIYRQLSWTKVPAALIRLNPPTWRFLRTTLHARQFDIVHFIGHAKKDEIQLEKEDGSSDWVSANDLAVLFQNTNVKLVVLNNCSSESIGDALISVHVPAVVATSRKIHSETATLLSGSLYSILANGGSLKSALEIIGQTIKKESGDGEETLVTALGSKGNEPVLSMALEAGDTDYFNCTPSNNLPPLSRDTFYDRVSDVLNIYKLLDISHSPFIGITGLAGTGKSTVAIVSAWLYSWRFSRGIAYISLRKTRPFNLLPLLGHFNWGLDNVSGTKQRDIALYELGRGPVLLLLDDLEEINLDESKEIIDILSSWNTTLGGRALLIMRRQRPEFDDLIQSNWISIGELPEAAAMEFFSARLGGVDIAMARLGANFTNVFSLCYCHPKLLILTAAALQLGVPWDQLATQLKQLVGTPIAKMEQVLEITISQIQRDSPIAGQFLDCWAVFAEAAIEEAWRFVLSGKMLGVDDPVRQWQNDALETIQRATILQRFSSENGVQCRIHPLVSEYLHSHRWSILTQEKREEYQVRHLNFYRESISSRSENYPIVLEWDNILLALKNTSKTKRWKEVIALCNILVGNERELLFRKNLWNHAKLALNYAIQAAQELSEQQLLAVFLHNLGISQYRTAEYQEAEKSFEQSLTIAIQIGDIDLVIRERLEIGRVCYRLMRYEQAEEYFEKVRIQAQLKGDLGRYAAALHELGRLAYRRKNASVAQQLLGEALQIRENVSIKLGVAQTLHELGRVQHDLALEAENAKQLEDAESLYQRSLALRREVGDYVGQQATIHQLGLLSFDQGHYERAQKYYSECIELSDALNDRFWIAHNQFRYARLLWRLHEYEEAARLASQSLELCTVLGVSLKTQVENWLKAPS